MANQWYLRRGSNVLGPSTSAQLKSDVAEGLVKRDDDISKSPDGPWTVARKVKGLFALQESEASDSPPSPTQDPPLSALMSELPNRGSSIANPSQSVVTSTANPSTTAYTKKSISLPQWAVIAIPAIVTLILGYFIGQEHLKYQMRSAMGNFATAFSDLRKGNSSSRSPSSPTGSVNTNGESTPEPLTQLMLGQTHKTKQFSLTLNKAKIETAKIKDMMGKIRTGKTPDLILSFTIANTDDRKILRPHLANQFMKCFSLRDDVGNQIRGINYGITSEPVGALTGSEDIKPGSSSTHIEIFSIPPPKTEFLILTVDLACFDGDGKIEFKIPATSIVK